MMSRGDKVTERTMQRQVVITHWLDMEHMFMLFMMLWSSGLQEEDGNSTLTEPFVRRLAGGSSHCAGAVELKQDGIWKKVSFHPWDLKSAAGLCSRLDCGSVITTGSVCDLERRWSQNNFSCVGSDSSLRKGLTRMLAAPPSDLAVACSESVRLVNGSSLCSGRVEVKSQQSWSSVCEDDFHLQDAEVVCRELGCGAPSVLQGALYGELESPVWSKEFHCEGNESVLLECGSSGSLRNSCSPGKAVGLTCSELNHARLVEGANRCAGTLEVRLGGDWARVDVFLYKWNLKTADTVCRQMDCGSAVSTGRIFHLISIHVWWIDAHCLTSGNAIRECISAHSRTSQYHLNINCTESVRLVNGPSLCSGRVEVKSQQLWSSVCEDDFHLQDAEVVCRELGCGAPSVLQGALFGDSNRNTCSSGKALGLTCSEPDYVRLVGGSHRCAGTLEIKHQELWTAVSSQRFFDWDLKAAAVVCRQLNCGSAVSTRSTNISSTAALEVESSCLHTVSALQECATLSDISGKTHLEVKCSESVRLVNGPSLCSGRVEVKSQQSWSSVCEDDFNLQDAEVVCRELGCGAPSVLQGALYGELESLAWSKELHCEGNESVFLECGSAGSLRSSCSPGKAVGLTCSELDYVRLVGEASRCAGTVQMNQQSKWRHVANIDFTGDLRLAAAVCKQLDCGSALSEEREDYSRRPVWIRSSCIQPDSALRECLSVPTIGGSSSSLKVICSDLLVQPIISLSPFIDGAQQQGHRVLLSSSFTINCSVEPQYPGGSFQLIVTTSKTALNYTLPAVNHSAHFHFSEANHTHQGDFSCVYHAYVFSHNFSSVSRQLSLTVSASVTELIIRVVVHLLIIVVFSVPLCFYCKSTRRQKPETEENIEMDYYNLGGSRAEGGVGDTTGAPPMGQEASRNLLPPHV